MIQRRVVSLIIENSEEKIMLMLRDNKPDIPFPNHWAFIGGDIEERETPEQALRRETKEELDYNLKGFTFFRNYTINDIEYNVYYIKGDYKIDDFKLNEGQEIKFFSRIEIPSLEIAFDNKKIILDYFNNKKIPGEDNK